MRDFTPPDFDPLRRSGVMPTKVAKEQGYLESSADISECEKYRWVLRRGWYHNFDRTPASGAKKPGDVCCFVMLNPSTADGTIDDPTIVRCVGFARREGFSQLEVRNLFPYRATNPAALSSAQSPAGDIRGAMELVKALRADLVVCGWGSSIPSLADLTRVPKDFVAEARRIGKPLFCFGVNADGNPKHPLYLKSDAALVPYPPLPESKVAA